MIALLQRVTHSAVRVNGNEIARIGRGVNILLGVLKEDGEEEVETLAAKILTLRIFPDEKGKMNFDISQISGEALVVSQFTLTGNVRKGRRPSFDAAMPPREARRLYELFCETLSQSIPVQHGEFGAMMEVEILNDGPVTFFLDSREL